MTDRQAPKANAPSPTTASARETKATHARSDNVSKAAASGLDTSGQMRIGDTITIAVANGDIQLTKSGSGEQVLVSEASLAGLLVDEYFVTKKA